MLRSQVSLHILNDCKVSGFMARKKQAIEGRVARGVKNCHLFLFKKIWSNQGNVPSKVAGRE